MRSLVATRTAAAVAATLMLAACGGAPTASPSSGDSGNSREDSELAIAAAETYGGGAGASRLVTGTLDVHDELEALITAAGGRTLALFTSYRALGAAVDALRPRLPYRIYDQRELPKTALVQAFAAEESACLFATTGLFQGIDVPGATLRVLPSLKRTLMGALPALNAR